LSTVLNYFKLILFNHPFAVGHSPSVFCSNAMLVSADCYLLCIMMALVLKLYII